MSSEQGMIVWTADGATTARCVSCVDGVLSAMFKLARVSVTMTCSKCKKEITPLSEKDFVASAQRDS